MQMMTENLSSPLQNQYLDNIIKNRSPVFIYLKNGIRLRGHIIGHDEEIILLREHITQIIYKNRINSVHKIIEEDNTLPS
jgi:host factor-I protein